MSYLVFIAIILALAWWLSGRRAASLNERLYLRRRGYGGNEQPEPKPQISRDAHLLGLIESLGDLSPFARERAAEELGRMCESGNRDARMTTALVKALDDNDASVRRAAAHALGNLGGEEAAESLKRRIEIEESFAVRNVLQKALGKISAVREAPAEKLPNEEGRHETTDGRQPR